MKSSRKTTPEKERNPIKSKKSQSSLKGRYTKQKSDQNIKAHECFVVGAAIKSGVRIQLRRKTKHSKKDKKLQQFCFMKIFNEEIERKIEMKFEEWKKEKNVEESEEFEQRSKDECKHIITLNVLIEYLQEHGEQIESKVKRTADKLVSRKSILSFNGLNEDDIFLIGKELSEYFIDELPTEIKKNKKETSKIIDSIRSDINIPINGDYSRKDNQEINYNQNGMIYPMYVYIPCVNGNLMNGMQNNYFNLNNFYPGNDLMNLGEETNGFGNDNN